MRKTYQYNQWTAKIVKFYNKILFFVCIIAQIWQILNETVVELIFEYFFLKKLLKII